MLLLALSLTSCGFHLRGTQGFEVALEQLYVSVPASYGELKRELERTFTQYDIDVVGLRTASRYALVINGERNTRRAVSTTSSISVAEYELRLEVDIQLTDRQGADVILPTTLMTERIYTFNRNSLVGSNEEETLLLSEMRSDLVNQIIRRVDASVRSFESKEVDSDSGS